MSDLADEQPVATAALAALNLLVDPFVAYEYDAVAKLATLPDQYVEVTVSRRFGGEARTCGGQATVGWRMTTRVVARTSTGARALRALVGGIERAVITANGSSSTPIAFESEEEIGADDGYQSGITAWTFTL